MPGHEVLQAYPEIDELMVQIDDRIDSDGQYHPEPWRHIVINPRTPNMRSTLLHEVQHAIQHEEGFARGGSPGQFAWEFEKNIRAPREKAAKELKRLNEKWKDTPEQKKRIDTFIRWGKDEAGLEEYAAAEKAAFATEAWKELDQAKSKYREEFGDVFVDGYYVWLIPSEVDERRNKYVLREYQKIAGETEARNVESRMNMTAEERAQSLASETEDIARSDQRILYQSAEDRLNSLMSQNDVSPEDLEFLRQSLKGVVEPAVQLTGNELGVNTNDIRELRQVARGFYREFQKSPVNHPELGVIQFTRAGWNEVVKTGASVTKWKMIPALPNIIRSAKVISKNDLTHERRDSIVAYYWLETNVELDGKNYRVGINIAEDENGNKFYNLNQDLDAWSGKYKASDQITDKSITGSQTLSNTASDALKQSIRQNGDGVNLFILNEKKQGKARGATIINKDRTLRIELFKDANHSTFMHETAHVMLEVYGDLAANPQASAYIKKEYATIRKYLGAKDGQPITREQHEKFARSFEKYLMEGKAPSPELQGIFSRFKRWLEHIYQMLRGLNVELSKDIRDVFDRMIASDEEIELMRDASELLPLFATAEKMGIAQEEFDAYKELQEKELVEAQDTFRRRAMRSKVREARKEYKTLLEEEKKRVAEEFDNDPVVSAFDFMINDETGEGKLNEDQLIRIYGKPFVSKLPKRKGKTIYSKNGQVELDTLASMVGRESGDELIRAFAMLPNREQWINDKARQNIMDREGDFTNSASIADAAEAALNNEYMEQRLKKELSILNRLKRVGQTVRQVEKKKRINQRKEAARIEQDVNSQVEAMRVAVKQTIAQKIVKDIKPYLYLRAMQKANRQARAALNKTSPDYAAATRLKQVEIMNSLMYKEARRVQQEINQRVAQAKVIARKGLKDAVKTRDSLFVNRAKYIAATLGLGGDAQTILQRIRTEEKNRPDVDPFVYGIGGDWWNLNASVALDALEDIKANWDQARRNKVMIIDGQRVEIDEAAEAINVALEDFGKSKRTTSRDDSARNELLKFIGDTILDQTRMEAWCDMVDGTRLGEATGPWMKYVFNPVKQAAYAARLAQGEYTKRLTEIMDRFQFTKETIAAPELGFTFGKDTGYGKAELIHALLHTGNMSNFQRLLVNRGWGTVLNGQVNAVKWNAFMARMMAEGRITEKDMDGVQAIWDLFDELKPLSQKAHKEVFGRFFDEITATPFFEFGKRYKGGYIPVIYDPVESGAGQKQFDPTKDLINEMGTAFPRLQAGWGNTRQEDQNFGPLLLDLSRLNGHISKQILFMHLAPVNMDVSRLLNRKTVDDTVRDYDPKFMGAVIKPWLSRAVTQNLEGTGKMASPYTRFAHELRRRAGAVAMFANTVNAIEQMFDMTAAFAKVKGRYLTAAFRTMLSDRAGTVQAVKDASIYMRDRMGSEIKAANGQLARALCPSRLAKLDQWIIDNTYFMQMAVDEYCGPLTWVAAYNQATESGVPHNQAVLQADSVVRQVFGANAAEDVSNFEAGGAFKRMFTQFMGYFIQRANLIAAEHSKIKRSDIANKKAAIATLYTIALFIPAWVGAALRKIAAGSDDDKDTFGSWLLDVFGFGTMNYVASMGGHVGQMANAAMDYYHKKGFNTAGRVFYPPAFKLIEDAIKGFGYIGGSVTSDEEINEAKFIQDMVAIERVAPGMPVIPGRPVATARYLYDVATDEVNPTGGYDFIRGVVTGRASADSRQ